VQEIQHHFAQGLSWEGFLRFSWFQQPSLESSSFSSCFSIYTTYEPPLYHSQRLVVLFSQLPHLPLFVKGDRFRALALPR
jgi:hypothetical protein